VLIALIISVVICKPKFVLLTNKIDLMATQLNKTLSDIVPKLDFEMILCEAYSFCDELGFNNQYAPPALYMLEDGTYHKFTSPIEQKYILAKLNADS
jgi:hypothetical protein